MTDETKAEAGESTTETDRHGRVVVGVDGSEASSVTLRWAADEARLSGATLKAVAARHIPSLGYGAYTTVFPEGFEDWSKETSALPEEQLIRVLGEEPGLSVVR